jgi:hypothetical protein
VVGLDDVLVSRSGRVYSTLCPELRRELGAAEQHDFDFPAYAVRNLGYLRFEMRGARSMLSFRPRLATPVATAAAFLRIAEKRPERVVVRSFVETPPEDGRAPTWRHEIFGELSLAFRRVEDLASTASSLRRTRRYLSQPLNLRRLAERRAPSLSAAFEAWRARGGTWSADLIPRLHAAGVGDRLTIVSRTHGDRLLIDYASAGYSSFRAWGVPAVGLDLEALPDREYGAWVAGLWRETLRDERPRLDYIDALIQSPGGPSMLACYDRLMLPWRSSSGQQVGMSVAAARAVFPQL